MKTSMADSQAVPPRKVLSRFSSHCLISLLLAFSAPLIAAKPSDDLVTINMHNADVTAVIQWIAELTRKKIVVDPRVKGKVTILAKHPMPAEQAYEVFLAMLNVYGYAASEQGGVLRIFPAAMASSTPSQVLRDFDNQALGEQVVHIVAIENVSATEVSKIIKPLIRVGGQALPFPSSNSLLLADQAGNIQRILQLIQQIDSTGSIDFQVVSLQHANSKDVAGLVESLLEAKTIGLTVASDERSNSVLMTGSTDVRSRAEQLIRQLDTPLSRSGNTRVIYLHYLDAAELVPILKGMSAALAKDKSADSKEFSIEASESANALVVTASPVLLDSIEHVVKQIDIRRAQVLVEAIIVEVSEDYAKQLGVEWNTNLDASGLQAATSFGLRSGDPGSGDASILGQGLSLGYVSNGSLRAVLKALATDSNSNILSTPSIVTLDNQEAEILVGSNIPLITGQSTGSASSTDDPFTTITREDIGVTLKVTPQINQGSSITMDVLQEIETVSESSTVANDIVTNKRSISTTVIIDDESILVLGGLISDQREEVESKVPFFGDIPLVGALFRSSSESITKRNLMVFIHPTIVDSEQVAEEVSQKNYQLMRELQKKYHDGKFTTEAAVLPDFTEYTPSNK
jgi:general secretion pathway protein D